MADTDPHGSARQCFSISLARPLRIGLAVLGLVAASAIMRIGSPAVADEPADDDFDENGMLSEQLVDSEAEDEIHQAQNNYAALIEHLDAVAARDRLDTNLRKKIAVIARVCGLTDAQHRRLKLACRRDVEKFFDRFAKLGTQFQLINNDPRKSSELLRSVAELRQEAQRLQRSNFDSDIWDDRSLFVKCLNASLTAEQLARYKQLRPAILAGGSIQTSQIGPHEEVEIVLSGTAFTDDGLATLSELPVLQTLFLDGTQITSAGLASVTRLRGLKHLVLDDTQVTDVLLGEA